MSDSGRRTSRGERFDLLRELPQQMLGAVVHEGMHRVQPQRIHVVVAQPHRRVVEDVPAHVLRSVTGEVHASPQVLVWSSRR